MTTFTVRGRGIFPVDMLRYDRCWPIEGERGIQEALWSPDTGQYEPQRGERTVTLRSAERFITDARWSSFGWCVIDRQEG